MGSFGDIVVLSCLALGPGIGMANKDHGGFRIQQTLGVGRDVDKNDTFLIEQLNDKPTPGHFIEDAKNKVIVAVLVTLGVIVLLSVLLALYICKRRKRVCFAKKRAQDNDPEAFDNIPLQSRNG